MSSSDASPSTSPTDLSTDSSPEAEQSGSVRVARRSHPSPETFRDEFVHPRTPVLMTNVLEAWPALDTWSPAYFKQEAPDLPVRVKVFQPDGEIETEEWTMGDYCDFLTSDQAADTDGSETPPPYCHDIPIFSILESLRDDVQPFPTEYFPSWYRAKWWRYVQFFMGPKNSITPLHFDCLLTHNLFFQVYGKKRFTLVPRDEWENCYRYDWRWFEVDPESPDLDEHPRFRHVDPTTVVVGPGDVLFIPAGVPHHVRGLGNTISFNIDWHTRRSAVEGVKAGLEGMPLQNVYYNALIALGLVFGVPEDLIFPFYKSYLSYVS